MVAMRPNLRITLHRLAQHTGFLSGTLQGRFERCKEELGWTEESFFCVAHNHPSRARAAFRFANSPPEGRSLARSLVVTSLHATVYGMPAGPPVSLPACLHRIPEPADRRWWIMQGGDLPWSHARCHHRVAASHRKDITRGTPRREREIEGRGSAHRQRIQAR